MIRSCVEMNINDVAVSVSTIQSNERMEQTKSRIQDKQQDGQQDLVIKGKVETTVEKLNNFVEPGLSDLQFVFHEDLHEYYVTVVDPLTKEVIKEIPPKKMLDMYAAMAEYMGFFIDKKI